MKVRRFLFMSIALALVATIAYSGYRLWDINHTYAQGVDFYNRLTQYKPTAAGTDDISSPLNQNLVNLETRYPDVAGWLTIPNTTIDYPFVQAKDNDYYLRRDLDGQYLFAGTLFLNYSNRQDFSDFNNIIFGHHMKNSSMFGDLQKFNDSAFFAANRTGTIFLADKTYMIEFFAFAVIKEDDPVIYDTTITTDTDKTAFLDHIKSTARYYRDIGVTTNDHLVTLSTCSYEFNNAREVLVGKLTEIR